ncbi:dUTP diphosphatase [Pseudoflavonifractor phocaeensis]|uniref:dUTP diphosphatase n=1 Tax=Pseudoflavonifractor phocaeensis TaxID=1870988 RepID=UPI00195EBA0B|nr:dUTP diphosphatase [Pseudoflavonifractor phocaeensis]MBM6927415.1 dUTP diphosphatase [Pseudoflavonifractor phocaeensis]
MTLKLKAVSPKAGKEIPFPTRATEGSAGLDLRACLEEPVTIAPRQLVTIPTGVAMALPGQEYVGLIFARSGLGVKHGVSLSNGVGVIDSDYRGELKVGLTNLSDVPYTIQPGDRIAQLVVTPVALPQVEIVTELDDTGRGTGGFGSTGQ